MPEDLDRHSELLSAIQGIKQDIYGLINARLDNFKSEILAVLDSNLKLFKHEINQEFDEVYKKLSDHEKQLSDHDKKFKDIESKSNEVIKSLFFRLSVIGLIGLAVNTIIVVAVVKFIK